MNRFAASMVRATVEGSRMGSRTFARGFSRGFSLVELALALTVLGLMASAAVAYGGLFRNGGKLATDAQLASLSESVIAFARTRNRLPCPDTAGSGYEALVADVCPSGIEVGWLPYLSLGLSQPAAQGRAVYGVYRKPDPSPAANADLAVSASLATLAIAAGQSTDGNHVYLTGDGTTANGTENCVTNVVSNPAYVILAPGEDRDGDGKQVDGIHSTLPDSGRCFAAPSRGVDTNFDDRTIALSVYALLAKLNQ